MAGEGLQVLGGGVLEVMLGYRCPLHFLAGDQREMLTLGKGGGWTQGMGWRGVRIRGAGKRGMMAVLEPMTLGQDGPGFCKCPCRN